MNFNNSELRFVRAPEQLSCELDGEIAILNLGSKLYFGLTEVAAAIWRELEVPQSLETIVAAVTARFDVNEAQCRSDVMAFLETLQDRRLLVVEDRTA